MRALTRVDSERLSAVVRGYGRFCHETLGVVAREAQLALSALARAHRARPHGRSVGAVETVWGALEHITQDAPAPALALVEERLEALA